MTSSNLVIERNIVAHALLNIENVYPIKEEELTEEEKIKKISKMSKLFDDLIKDTIDFDPSKLALFGCKNCDPNFLKLTNIETIATNKMLASQLRFESKLEDHLGKSFQGKWVLTRHHNALFQILGTFKMQAKHACNRIVGKLKNLPNTTNEVDFKLLQEFNVGNLLPLDQYLKSKRKEIEMEEQRAKEKITFRFQINMLVVNTNSESTPIRIVQTSNIKTKCQTNSQDIGLNEKTCPKSLSYNETVRTYKIFMPRPVVLAIIQSIHPPILQADIKGAFLVMKKSVRTALSEIHFYLSRPDGTPTLNASDAIDINPKPHVSIASSFGNSDLPALWSFTVQNTPLQYKNYYPEDHLNKLPNLPIYNPEVDYSKQESIQVLENELKDKNGKVLRFKRLSDTIIREVIMLTITGYYADDFLGYIGPTQMLAFLVKDNILYNLLAKYLEKSCKVQNIKHPDLYSIKNQSQLETKEKEEKPMSRREEIITSLLIQMTSDGFQEYLDYTQQLYSGNMALNISHMMAFGECNFKKWITTFSNVNTFLERANIYAPPKVNVNLTRPSPNEVFKEIRESKGLFDETTIKEQAEDETLSPINQALGRVLYKEDKMPSIDNKKPLDQVTATNLGKKHGPTKYLVAPICKSLGFKIKPKSHLFFKATKFEDFEAYIEKNGLTRRQLLSCASSLYDVNSLTFGLTQMYFKLALRHVILTDPLGANQKTGWERKVDARALQLAKIGAKVFFAITQHREHFQIGKVNFHPLTTHYLVCVHDGGEFLHAFQIILVSHYWEENELKAQSQILSQASYTNPKNLTSSRSEILGAIKCLQSLTDCIESCARHGLEVESDNIIIATDSTAVLYWLKSSLKLNKNIVFLVTKLQLAIYNLKLSPYQNIYFFNQKEQIFPADILSKALPGNPTTQQILKAYDNLTNTTVFHQPREMWNRFLKKDIYLPNAEDASFLQNLAMDKNCTIENISDDIKDIQRRQNQMENIGGSLKKVLGGQEMGLVTKEIKVKKCNHLKKSFKDWFQEKERKSLKNGLGPLMLISYWCKKVQIKVLKKKLNSFLDQNKTLGEWEKEPEGTLKRNQFQLAFYLDGGSQGGKDVFKEQREKIKGLTEKYHLDQKEVSYDGVKAKYFTPMDQENFQLVLQCFDYFLQTKVKIWQEVQNLMQELPEHGNNKESRYDFVNQIWGKMSSIWKKDLTTILLDIVTDIQIEKHPKHPFQTILIKQNSRSYFMSVTRDQLDISMEYKPQRYLLVWNRQNTIVEDFLLKLAHMKSCGRDAEFVQNSIIKSGFYMTAMIEKLNNIAKTCKKCRSVKIDRNHLVKVTGNSGSIELNNALNPNIEYLALDACGPFIFRQKLDPDENSDKQFESQKYITKKFWVLLFVHLKTRFVHLDITTSQSSEDLAQCIIRTILKTQGIVNRIIADRQTAYLCFNPQWSGDISGNRSIDSPENLQTTAEINQSLKGRESQFILISGGAHSSLATVESRVKQIKSSLITLGELKSLKKGLLSLNEIMTILAQLEFLINMTPQFTLNNERITPWAMHNGRMFYEQKILPKIDPFMGQNKSKTTKEVINRLNNIQIWTQQIINAFFNKKLLSYLLTGGWTRKLYKGRYGIPVDHLSKGSLCLDFLEYEKTKDYDKSLCLIKQTAKTSQQGFLVRGSGILEIRKLDNNDPKYKEKYKRIITDRRKLKYRQARNLIGICLQNEQEFFTDHKVEIAEIENFFKIYEENQNKFKIKLSRKEDDGFLLDVEDDHLYTIYDGDQVESNLEDESDDEKGEISKKELDHTLEPRYNLRSRKNVSYKEN